MTYALIPGAGGAAWYWHRVEAELRDRVMRALHGLLDREAQVHRAEGNLLEDRRGDA